MDPASEAAAILTRLFESLARASCKTLSARSRADITRACELLGRAGAELDELLDDAPAAPRVSPAEAVIAAAEHDPDYQEWRRRRATQERR